MPLAFARSDWLNQLRTNNRKVGNMPPSKKPRAKRTAISCVPVSMKPCRISVRPHSTSRQAISGLPRPRSASQPPPHCEMP